MVDVNKQANDSIDTLIVRVIHIERYSILENAPYPPYIVFFLNLSNLKVVITFLKKNTFFS